MASQTAAAAQDVCQGRQPFFAVLLMLISYFDLSHCPGAVGFKEQDEIEDEEERR
tara:strand:- start:181 stop:345 length:165 start_codon:yes stop_codon:yes gene_type:complete